VWTGSGHGLPLEPVIASPKELGRYLFEEFWFSVEVASFLLFVALAGALYLGRERDQEKSKEKPAEVAS
jgi:NADH:ubiquinone oxidoreductase subunit 6 (subunit J)